MELKKDFQKITNMRTIPLLRHRNVGKYLQGLGSTPPPQPPKYHILHRLSEYNEVLSLIIYNFPPYFVLPLIGMQPPFLSPLPLLYNKHPFNNFHWLPYSTLYSLWIFHLISSDVVDYINATKFSIRNYPGVIFDLVQYSDRRNISQLASVDGDSLRELPLWWLTFRTST